MLLYFPYILVNRIEIAMTMGVGMHWMQYLGLTIPLYLRKSKKNIERGNKNFITAFASKTIYIFSFLFVYAFIMVLLRQWETGLSYDYSSLFFFPISLRLLHFYYDAFIWRFSNLHIRNEIGKYVFGPTIDKGKY